jgi:dihydrofolate reductase
MILSIVVAADEHNVIGDGKTLLWKLPADLAHFRRITEGHTVIMGRKTYESIGRPLPNRQNIIVTRRKNFAPKGCEIVSSINKAINLVSRTEGNEAFVIGGGEIYRQVLPIVHTIYFTRVHGTFKGDVTFPILVEEEWKEVSREEHPADTKNSYAYTFLVYERASDPHHTE